MTLARGSHTHAGSMTSAFAQMHPADWSSSPSTLQVHKPSPLPDPVHKTSGTALKPVHGVALLPTPAEYCPCVCPLLYIPLPTYKRTATKKPAGTPHGIHQAADPACAALR